MYFKRSQNVGRMLILDYKINTCKMCVNHNEPIIFHIEDYVPHEDHEVICQQIQLSFAVLQITFKTMPKFLHLTPEMVLHRKLLPPARVKYSKIRKCKD